MITKKALYLCALSIGIFAGCDDNSAETQNPPSDSDDQPVIEPVCGNDILEPTEVCDETKGVPSTCEAWDSSKRWASGGKPACRRDCLGIDPGTCREIQCGDGRVEGSEICDGTEGLPASCAAWDGSKKWASGGAPECIDCRTIAMGTCREIQCGDGFVDGDEICDGKAGLPATCSDWNNAVSWLPGGAPECDASCHAILQGTCEPAPKRLDIMNWNVLFEYDAWGGSAVLPRAQILHDLLEKYEYRPDFISMVEASQQWHYPEVNALLDDLGYAWAEPTPPNDDDTGYYMTQVIYQKDRFDVIETDFVTLYPYTDEGDRRHKCVSFAAVLREKDTNAEFVIMSTHWDPNIESNKCTYGNNIAGPIVMRETNRVKGVGQTVRLIEKLRDKYPDAHFFYGGDLNTIDFQLIFDSPSISAIVGSNMEKLIRFANALYVNQDNEPCGKPFPDDFVGSFDTFVATSGLLSARNQAIDTQIAINDVSSINAISAEADGMGDTLQTIIEGLLSVKLIIDYAFYSPNLTLTEYEIMLGEDYVKISDHYPVRTSYTYEVK